MRLLVKIHNSGPNTGINSRVKQIIKLSRGEICVANFIPHENGASQGIYFLGKIPKIAVFEAKMG